MNVAGLSMNFLFKKRAAPYDISTENSTNGLMIAAKALHELIPIAPTAPV